MYCVADTTRLLHEVVLTPSQVEALRVQARETMMRLGVNVLVAGGIIAATLGLIFWLAAPVPVAFVGLAALGLGSAALAKGSETQRFFGNAAAVVGAGLLLGGAGVELADTYSDTIAGPAMLTLGLAVAGLSLAAMRIAPFTFGAIAVMGTALNLAGLGVWAQANGWTG